MPELYLFLMLVKITAGSESVTAVMKAVAASEGKHLFLAIILILELLSVEGGEFPKLLLQACGSYCVSVVCLQLNRHFIAKRIQFTPESHEEQYTGFKQHN